MTRMAPRSSAIASAVRNILSDTGTRSPSIERMPMAKAMSVAVGIPQPLAAIVPWLKAVKMIAGKSMPPAAASTGRRAFLADESCPQTISRFISSPTAKKKITIRPSLISFSTVIPRGNTQSISPSGLCTISERSVSSR